MNRRKFIGAGLATVAATACKKIPLCETQNDMAVRGRTLRSVVSPGCPTIIPPPVPTFDPDAVIFFGGDDFATEFYSDDTAKHQINDLIVRKKDMGTWDDLLWLCPIVGNTQATIAKSVKNPDRFLRTYPNGATFAASMEQFNGTNQYAKIGWYPSKQMSSYSLCMRWMVKENTFGADDYSPFGLEPGLIVDHFFHDRLFVVLGLNNAPANVWVLNPAPFGKLMAINYHSMDTVDYWQDGTLFASQVNDVRGYLPPLDPSDALSEVFLNADNNAHTPINFSPMTNFYQEVGHAQEDSVLVADDDYIKNTFCPALFKIPD
jgi:hypothetical protein